MGFAFQRRLNLGKGAGINFGKTGASLSYRNKAGSIGTSGFSVRSGIPGLGYRHRWGKDGAYGWIALGIAAMLALTVTATLWMLSALWQLGEWCFLTARDYIEYRRNNKI